MNKAGIWYLQDIFFNLEENYTLHGSALYEDKYVKESGEWKIASTAYKRLFEEIQQRNDSMKITVKPIND